MSEKKDAQGHQSAVDRTHPIYGRGFLEGWRAAKAHNAKPPEPCTMGAGCDEAGVCYAMAHGEPDRCCARGDVCDECGGTGEVFWHSDDCADALCALNGDEHSCSGQILHCACRPACASGQDSVPPLATGSTEASIRATVDEMASEAGNVNELTGDAIERFAALVRAQAMEDCAVICEWVPSIDNTNERCAAAIRAAHIFAPRAAKEQ